jgi:hypothetical protein
MREGIITVVGSRSDPFNCLGGIRQPFYSEDDPGSFYYNEYCGHLYNLGHVSMDAPFIGLEHYRRTFVQDGRPLGSDTINAILDHSDIIVKQKHGPYGTYTNLTVHAACSRHGLNYMAEARQALAVFPELRKQADDTTHYGCNIFIARPATYVNMVSEAKDMLDVLLKICKQRSFLAYFTETIITPYLIGKYCKDVHIADVLVSDMPFIYDRQ